MMRPRRTKPIEDDPSGQDSFLDIVTNVVGVLVILILVVGVRAARTPREPTEVVKEKDAVETRGEELLRRGLYLKSERARLAHQANEIGQEMLIHQQSRDQLQLMATAAKAALEQLRGQLDTQSRRNFDLQVSIDASRRELDRLTQKRLGVDSVHPESIRIESLPTPLSRAVEQKEIHFQLAKGRIVELPMDQLVAAFETKFRSEAQRLSPQSESVGSVGPIDGFRMRYLIRRFDLPVERQIALGYSGSVARVMKWEMVPLSAEMGETVDEALAEGSRFREILKDNSPRKTVITIWTYPDSFDAFRQLKKTLYSSGFQTAARPLPEGVLIAGSPNGTRSAAQ